MVTPATADNTRQRQSRRLGQREHDEKEKAVTSAGPRSLEQKEQQQPELKTGRRMQNKSVR